MAGSYRASLPGVEPRTRRGVPKAREQIDALAEVVGGAGRSVAPVAYVPEIESTPRETTALANGRRMRAGVLASGAVSLLLLGVLAGRPIFGAETPTTTVAQATARREVVVERNALVVASSARAQRTETEARSEPVRSTDPAERNTED